MSSKRDTAAQRLGYESQAERERIRRLYAKHNIEWQSGQRKPSKANIARIISGRKPRNYQAEEQRRNQRARERGFTSRAAQRGYKRKLKTKLTAPRESTTFTEIPDDKLKYDPFMDTLAAQTELWVPNHRTRMVEYHPEDATRLGLTHEEYTLAYYRAFIGPESWARNRRRDTSALKVWFVLLNDYLSEAEYDERYHS